MTNREVWHGRYSTYIQYHCRCEACCRDAARYRRELRAKRAQLGVVMVGPRKGQEPEHGIYRYQRYGCRCEICRTAQRDVSRAYRARRRERTGKDR